ncbi:beta strand repeat-containing protein [Acidovorax sp. LjRoot194]|uniref:beta strand repeat-containing protein n=1 Tax=Acidovorax sp. LjRoot194 TaxID=3342280 RepID=UPI003ECD358C
MQTAHRISSFSLLRLFTILILIVLSACGGSGGGASDGPSAPTLSTIEVTSASPSIAAGTTVRLAATAIYSDNSHQDVTSQVAWASANTAVATVSPSTGLVTAIAPGAVSLSATLNGKSGTTVLTVTAATVTGIAVTPSISTLPAGTTTQFSAIGTFSDGTTHDLGAAVRWRTSDVTRVKVDTSGLATAMAPGGASVMAKCQNASLCGSLSSTATLNVTAASLVSIAVTPTTSAVALGAVQQFMATGTYSDGSTQNLSTQVNWTSTATGVASIDAQGVAMARGTGTTGITATLASVSSPAASLTAAPASLVSISISPGLASVAVGLPQQFTATGTYDDQTTQVLTNQVTWSSSNPAVATISNAAGTTGRASTLASGTAAITARIGNLSSQPVNLTVTAAKLVSIDVTPKSPSVPKGMPQQFTATGIYTDQTTQTLTAQVTWASSSPAVATISNAAGTNGQATTLGTGATSITASLGSVSSAPTTLTVTPATLLSIAVTPSSPSVPKGRTQQFTATGTYTDQSMQVLTTQVTWTSSSTSVATISNAAGTNGEATTLTTGTSAITASLGAVTSPATTLIVVPATLVSIAVTPTSPSVPKGLSQQFTAIASYTDGSTQDVTTQVSWSSSNASVASISNAPGSNGRATALASGTSSIRATQSAISSPAATMTVSAAALASIVISPGSADVVAGGTQQYTATGRYTDGSTQNITTSVNWTSDAATVATISNTPGSQGLATTLAAGSTNISATLGSVSANPTSPLTVRPGATFAIPGAATWTVPSGVTRVRIVATGGGGASSRSHGSNTSPGGHGGRVTAVLTVNSGDTFALIVGGGGQASTYSNNSYGGGGGGGASSFRAGTADQIIAGGGGGGGVIGGRGGNGGGAGTGAGEAGSGPGAASGGGAGIGGAGGTDPYGFWNGSSGGAGNGGGGGSNTYAVGGAGNGGGNGGNGGGLFGSGGGGGYGGGGGSASISGTSGWGGGGGGGSTGPSGSSYSVSTNGGNSSAAGGDGSITIEYLP